MQLNKPKNIKSLLTAATCSLLGTQVTQAQEKTNDWQFDTALMYYDEQDRVSALEGIIAAKKTFGNDEVLSLKFTVDSLTGASPSGAVPQPEVQTFTRPSGEGKYEIAANETPLDDTFKDTRYQFTGQWSQPLADEYTLSIGGNTSKEHDYQSLSLNTNLAKDFNQKNTTVSIGAAFSKDTIDPEGGVPNAMQEAFSNLGIYLDTMNPREKEEDKDLVDLLVGVTQVINKRMIVQFNYSYSKADGYLTDPYKVLSEVDDEGYTDRVIYENRPDERTKHAFFAQTKYHFDTVIADVSYRFMTDDWEIDSHTIESRWRLPLSDGHYIEPHVRYYTQSAAEFYTPFLLADTPLPTYASADYRIGEMDAITLGVKYGLPLSNGERLAFRLEYYQQSPESNGTEAIGVLKDQDLYEEVKAVIAQVSYSF